MIALCKAERLAWLRYAAPWSFRLLNFWRRLTWPIWRGEVLTLPDRFETNTAMVGYLRYDRHSGRTGASGRTHHCGL